LPRSERLLHVWPNLESGRLWCDNVDYLSLYCKDRSGPTNLFSVGGALSILGTHRILNAAFLLQFPQGGNHCWSGYELVLLMGEILQSSQAFSWPQLGNNVTQDRVQISGARSALGVGIQATCALYKSTKSSHLSTRGNICDKHPLRLV
jgi:hypothetical protein